MGEKATLTVKATGDGLKYQWYYANKGVNKFTKASITGNTCSVEMSSSRNGRRIYCVVTDKYGNSVQSNTVTINAATALKITTQPKSVTVPVGEKATLTVKATGDGLKYQWYYANEGAKSFSKSSVTSATYAVEMTDSRAGRRIYCVVTDQYGQKIVSQTVTMHMQEQSAGMECFNGMWRAAYYGSLVVSAESVGIRSLMVIEDGEIYIQQKEDDGVISGTFIGTMKDGKMVFSSDKCQGTLEYELLTEDVDMITLTVKVDGQEHCLTYMSL